MINYKNIRKEPFLYGFTVKAFFVFVVGFIVSGFTFLGGFSLTKFILFVLFDFALFCVCKFILSNAEVTNKILDNKLPKSYSDYE